MFKIVQNPLQKLPISSHLPEERKSRPAHQRYTSVDQIHSRPKSSLDSSLFEVQKYQKRGLTIQKSDRTQKQRAHSQKKLTLTSAQPSNNCYNSSLSTSQNMNQPYNRQNYEGLRKNLQLKSLNTTRNMPLEKKGKYAVNKQTQHNRYPTSSSSIRIQSQPVIGQNENEQEILSTSIKFQKDKNIQQNRVSESNNYLVGKCQNYYKQPVVQTAPSSPVYENNQRIFKFQGLVTKQVTPQQPNSNAVIQYCQQKMSQLKDQTSRILFQNSKKIKQLQTLLLLNKQQLQAKDKIIRNLQVNLVLKQTSKPQSYSHHSQYSTSSQVHLRIPSIEFKENNSDLNKSQPFLNAKLYDLEKKVETIQQHWENEQKRIDQKIDQMNDFMQSFVSVKIHNLKFTLKAFISKTQQKMNTVLESVFRVQNIVKLNQIDEYERLYIKIKKITQNIEKLSQIKVPEKLHYDDMKTTINTTIEGYKQKPNKQNYQNMFESRQINESFWKNMEDFYENKIEDQSFTDDSFSYAPKSNTNINITSTNNSSVNKFPLRSFPSFSKFSGQMSREYLSSVRTSMTEIESVCVRTIEEISKCRQGAVNVYLDKNGSIRYKSSESYIFDRKGNILKPSATQIEYCINKGWIILT